MIYINNKYISNISNKIHNFIGNNKDYEHLDLDSIFYNCEDIQFLKVHKKLNTYVYLKLKRHDFSENDIMWSIYNEVKSQCEIEKDYCLLSGILSKMSILLARENNKRAIDFFYPSLYCYGYWVLNIRKDNNINFGTTRLRDLKTLLEKSKRKYNTSDFKNSIMELIPICYDEKTFLKISKIIQDNL